MRFSTKAEEELKFYVYLLIDPRNDQIFYIGKGQNSRCFEHIQEAQNAMVVSDKCSQIMEILNSSLKIKISILRHHLTESEALLVESTSIDLLKVQLTNQVSGHDSSLLGLMSTDQIENLYSAEPLVEIPDKVIFINVNKLYDKNMSSNEVYEITRKAWVVSKDRANKAQYAITTYKGITRFVFEIDEWKESTSHEGRFEFNGREVSAEIQAQYCNKSLRNFIKPGSSNPIKYSFN